MPQVHPTAIVEKGARLSAGVVIGPYAHIGPEVYLSEDVRVGAHSTIYGHTKIGARTKIWPFASVGSEPQDLKYGGETTRLVCGEDNMIREYVNISTGTAGGGGETVIGDRNLFMVHSHIAHDCRIGNDCIFANGVSLGGHILIEDKVTIGGHAALHQFVKIGSLAMLAGGSIIVQDVPPFFMVHGNHATPVGPNFVGLKRASYSRDMIKEIKTFYRILYNSGLSLAAALNTIRQEFPDSRIKEHFLRFLESSQRGFCR